MCLSSIVSCNISLCKYFRDSVGVNVGMLLVCNIHRDSNGVGMRGNSSSVLMGMFPLVVLSRNKVRVISDLVQS